MSGIQMSPAVEKILFNIRSRQFSDPSPLLAQALIENPGNFDYLFSIAISCIENNLLSEAELIFTGLLTFKNNDVRILYNLGLIYSLARDYKNALQFYQRAAGLDPNDVDILINIGATLNKLHRYKEANEILTNAIAIAPDQPYSWQNRGYALVELYQFRDALNNFDRAIQLDPGYRDAWFNRGNVLEKLNRFNEARGSYQKALAIDPDDALAKWGSTLSTIPAIFLNPSDKKTSRENFHSALFDLEIWINSETRLINSANAVGSQQPFYLAYQEVNNKDLLSLYGEICHKVMGSWQKRQDFKLTKRVPTKRASIGIVTNHILEHSVWNALVKGWVQNLNRDLFEIHIFYISGYIDQETVLAKSLSTSFTENLNSLEDWAQAILEKQVDILIYPEIGMDPLTCKLANLRLAPVQVASWGHPDTTGLPTIDYYVSAKDFEPINAENHYSEKLVSLPNLGCYYSARSVSPATPDFDALGIDPTTPILICPGTPFKYAPEHDKVFVSIAQRLPGCQFIFFESQENAMSLVLKERLSAAFNHENLEASNFLRFIPWQKTEAFYGLMQKADVFLDTIGFSGFNTAIQAIECGLPIVTREGLFMRGRLASGILRRMGMTELITDTEQEYVNLVVKLVQDREYRAAIQNKIIANRAILFDDLEPIRALERFLIERASINSVN